MQRNMFHASDPAILPYNVKIMFFPDLGEGVQDFARIFLIYAL